MINLTKPYQCKCGTRAEVFAERDGFIYGRVETGADYWIPMKWYFDAAVGKVLPFEVALADKYELVQASAVKWYYALILQSKLYLEPADKNSLYLKIKFVDEKPDITEPPQWIKT